MTTQDHRRPTRAARLGRVALATSVLAAGWTATSVADDTDLLPALTYPSGVRVATFNVSLNRSEEGGLIASLDGGTDAQAQAVAQIIQRARPEVLLVNEFDFDAAGIAAALFQSQYLAVSQNGGTPITYEHVYLAPSNTGIDSGFDLDNDGATGGPGDAQGFGFFPGQFAMLVLSQHPIVEADVRTFQTFLWKDMPGALLPDDPATPEPADWFTPEELEVVRLSSKSHWDVPIDIDGTIVHLLASHPTPPVFDGPEDRNGRRNHDEIRFWADYVDPAASAYVYDDAGTRGGLPAGAAFVIAGDQNADPFDGDSTMDAALQLTQHPLIDTRITPGSPGGVQQAALQGGANDDHVGDPRFDTADFADGAPGNLRVDYVLPSVGLPLVGAGVFWPADTAPLFDLVGTFPFPSSDHRMVWIDLSLPGATLPAGVAAGDVTPTSAVLWTLSSVAGPVLFEWSTDPGFGSIAGSAEVTVDDVQVPAKTTATDLMPGTEYFHRVVDAAGSTAMGRFRTAPAPGARPGLRFGVSGDWRGELAPYPAITNIVERDIELFVALGDTIYADVESPVLPLVDQAMTPEQYRLKHAEPLTERFGLNAWRDVRSTLSLLATIDDHEVINDFSGGAHPSSDPRFAGQPGAFINETPLFEAGLGAFVAYHPMADEFYGETGDPRTANKRKLYRSRQWGDDAAFFVLDNRSFRDEPLPPVVDPTNPDEVIAFIVGSFDPTRTMLGDVQLQDLLADLSAAEANGVLWKFVIVPEPIQNLGVVAASDRFEGYAAERTAILAHIKEHDIRNVVFIAADIHGTVVNNLQYQEVPFGPQIDVTSFETSTGAVAYDAPFGPTVIELAFAAGIITPEIYEQYLALPPALQDGFLEAVLNDQLQLFQYDSVGLDGAPVSAVLLEGGWSATHWYGWTEFDIAAESGTLTVTTWGIAPYSRDEVNADPAAIVEREPMVIHQYVVLPDDGGCPVDLDGSGTVDFFDLLTVLGNWGVGDVPADLDGDGEVGFTDLLLVLGNWGPCA